MPKISMIDLAKYYGNFVAVDHFNLEVQEGELVALLGPSGCGKTTTLRMGAGFIPVSRGQILFGSKDVTELPPYRRNTGMVFQSYALFPHLTVFQNVAYGLEMRRVSGPDIRKRVMTMLERVRVAEFADRLPGQLSGGQQQRVALARALVIEPDVLLLDEPLSNLDAKLRVEVRGEIRQLQKAFGHTTIFVTHDQEEALSIADRLVVMSRGKIEQCGTPVELYERPRSRFVADFMGRANFFPGHAEGRTFVCDIGLRVDIPQDATVAGEDAVLGVRPERMNLKPLGDKAASPSDGTLVGRIEDVTYLGSVIEFKVRVADMLLVVEKDAQRASGVRTLQAGDPVEVSWLTESSMIINA